MADGPKLDPMSSLNTSLAVIRAAQKFKKGARRKTFKYAEINTGVLSWRMKIMYGLPQFSLLSLTMLISVHITLFYERLGASLTFIAFFTALARSFDVLTDPVMAWISDSTRTDKSRRFLPNGRRRPYMAIACFGYAVAFVLLSSPPRFTELDAGDGYSAGEDKSTAYWFGFFYMVFYAFDTVANIPYTALGPELTDESEERTSLYMVQKLFGGVGTLVGAGGPFILGLAISDERTVFSLLAVIFAVWYILSMQLLVYNVREREASLDIAPIPFAPSIMRSMSNKPFRPLLIGWILDYIALASLASMFPFFVTYIIHGDSDYDGVCNECGDEGCNDLDAEAAKATLALCISGLFVANVIAIPIWKFISNKFTKRYAWLSYNVVNSITCFLFIFLGDGQIALVVFITVLNGLPTGGQFLIESILADVIDYDEFLYATRSEGGFTVFATFIPKVVSIPAQALPLAVIAAVGFTSSCGGIPQEQGPVVKATIRVIFALVPSILTAISFAIKLRYPIKTDLMIQQINKGIESHMKGEAAQDPITGEMVTIEHLDEHDQQISYEIITFSRKAVQELLREQELKHKEGLMKEPDDPDVDTSVRLVRTMLKKAVVGVTISVISAAIVGGTFSFLNNPALAWIPALMCISMGLSLVFGIFHFLRWTAAKRFERKCRIGHPDRPTVVRLSKARDKLANAKIQRGTGTRTRLMRKLKKNKVGDSAYLDSDDEGGDGDAYEGKQGDGPQ